MSAFITVLRVALVIICVRCRPCIRSYSDHFIDYILQNINTDSSIIDLGHKISTEQCQNSCINLNYLCDFSIDNVFDQEGAASDWQIDSQTCTITVPSGSNTGLAVTSDLVSEEYIIDVQLTVATGWEGGVIWKSNLHPDLNDYYGYFVCADPNTLVAITGRNYPPAQYDHLQSSFAIEYNTKYNLSVHMNGTQFTTYVNQEPHVTSEIDEAIYANNYAAIYSYYAAVTFHSFRMRYVSAVEDEYFCAAYVYDKSNGDCYGYYGTEYTQIESSLTSDTQQQYDSAILDDSSCSPTNHPSNDPSRHPSNDPSTHPSNDPTIDPSNDPSQHPSDDPSNNPSNDPTDDPSAIPTRYRHQSEGRVFESTNNYESTFNAVVTKDGAMMNPIVVVSIVITVSVLLILAFCVFLFFYLLKRTKADAAVKGEVVMTKDDAEGMEGMQTYEDNQNIVSDNGVTKGDTNDGICDDEFVVVGDDEINDTAGAW
eukprot:527563_1